MSMKGKFVYWTERKKDLYLTNWHDSRDAADVKTLATWCLVSPLPPCWCVEAEICVDIIRQAGLCIAAQRGAQWAQWSAAHTGFSLFVKTVRVEH